MERKEIIVPKGIRYVGEKDPETGKRKWTDYNIWNIEEPHILNKELTGCGFTEYCLTCPYPIVLVSPRKFLLENKWEQHKKDVLYFQNDNEVSVNYELNVAVDDIKAIKEKAKTLEEGKHETLENLETLKAAFRCAIKAKRQTSFNPLKILVTYDSFKHVKDCLQHLYHDESDHTKGYDNIFDKFYIVVDEFQSIFIDARFKSDTEIELLSHLKGVKKVCYVSATPMLDRYLEMLDEFKDLPYYRFNWEKEDPGRIINPDLEVKFTTKSLNDEAKAVIDSYKNGKFKTRLDKEGNMIESREAVIFMNSVKGICQVIKTNRLHTDQVNVICAETTKNKEAVRKAFDEVLRKETEELMKHPRVPKEYEVIGRIPLQGEPHKMFTLCTRTVYLGADFCSTNARTFIFSDSNIDCLSVDISMDLEQILGRQRLIENPWKNSATMFVRCTDKKHQVGKEVFDKRLEEKTGKTNRLLDSFDEIKEENKFDIAENFLKVASTYHYKDDYVSVTVIRNWSTGKVVRLIPVFNKLMQVSEMRAFDVQQIDYKDRVSVFNAVGKEGIKGITEKAKKLAAKFNDEKDTSKRLRFLVDLKDMKGVTEKDINPFLELIPPNFKEYYTIMGPEFIKKYSCNEAEIKREWKNLMSNTGIQKKVDKAVYSKFEVGKRYTKTDIKNTLKKIYENLEYKKTAKATDLDLYFDLKPILTPDKKHGFELLKIKEITE